MEMQKNVEQCHREIEALKELMQTHVSRIDKAVIVSHEDLVRVPTDVQKAVSTVKELMEERLKSLTNTVDLLEKHSLYISELRAKHQIEMDGKESNRLDAIRQVDQLAVKTEAERATTAVATLAAAANTTAETLRTTVANSANALAGQFEKTVNSIVERLANLEKSSYLGAGKAGVSDPLIQKMAESVDVLVRNQSQNVGQSTGKRNEQESTKNVWGYIVGAIGLLIAIVSFVLKNKP